MTGNLDDELTQLRASGASMIDAIKYAMEHGDLTLGEAKPYVAQHPAWRDVHEANQPLLDAAERALYMDAERPAKRH